LDDLRKSICIGIPCYSTLPSYQTLEDYMRFAYYLGRRYEEYDFFLAIRGKKEQFRARNSIVEEALRAGCDYIFMLDDDQIIDIDKSMLASSRYLFLKKLIGHMDADPGMGIVGALYYQKGDTECWPVVMQKNSTGGYFFISHPEIAGGMQRADAVGGGAMLIRASVFDKIGSPWFEPELDLGTDIQICKKVEEAGFTVWCDTSIEIGHTRSDREVVTSKTIKALKRSYADAPGYENSELCTICKGDCCKSMPACAMPIDFLPVTASGLAEKLKTGKWAVDWLDADTMDEPSDSTVNKAYFIRPAVRGADALCDTSKQGECVFLGADRCELEFSDRPSGCKHLEPKDGGCLARGGTVRDAAMAWAPYRGVIEEAINAAS